MFIQLTLCESIDDDDADNADDDGEREDKK